jgi:hypothetical protein
VNDAWFIVSGEYKTKGLLSGNGIRKARFEAYHDKKKTRIKGERKMKSWLLFGLVFYALCGKIRIR